jgi:uncharacterized protein
VLTLSDIYVYPVKSLGGIRLESSVVQRRGLQYDRRWMLTDPEGKFLTQREIPEMALLGTRLEAESLVLYHKLQPEMSIRVPLEPDITWMPQARVQVWGDRLKAYQHTPIIHQWCSDMLGFDARLVYMTEHSRRAADGRYAPKGQYVSFADGFPFLLLGQASLDDLNSRLEKSVPMDRFRPNLVFQGAAPYAEDGFADFWIGDQPFRGVKPCARCVLITTDQATAQRYAEPLRTLSTYRKSNNKVYFGQNTVWMGEGSGLIRVGEPLRVVS